MSPEQKNESIELKFWGVRGSIPSPPTKEEIEGKIISIAKEVMSSGFDNEESVERFVRELPVHRSGLIGGNTSCVYINIAGNHIILDAGSGMRRLSNFLMKEEFGSGEGTAHIFLSHTHWDHIMGFPFFTPAYTSGNTIIVYGAHTAMEQRISNQQEDEYFPVSLSSMGANIDFKQLRKGDVTSINGIAITNKMLNHPGGSFGYRIDYGGKSVVYATDSEYKDLRENVIDKYIDFFKDADVLIFDAQFTLTESIEKENWGHSTSSVGVDLAITANVKHLILFHHDPEYSDGKLADILENAVLYSKLKSSSNNLKVSLAYEGMELSV